MALPATRARNATGSSTLLALAAMLTLAGCQLTPPAIHAPVVVAPPAPAEPLPPATPPAAATAPVKEPFRNVYTQEQDSAPAAPQAIDFTAIPDALPRAEPRGRYGNKSPYTVRGRTYRVLPSAGGYRAEGTASWYGNKFHGFMTSSMERYDMHAMTAAHTTLPIPSYVRVTHLGNGRSVVVRVNDRGPFHKGRLIDLSWAAAQKLGYAQQGTAPVRVESIDIEPPAPANTAPAATGQAAAGPAATATAATVPAAVDAVMFFVQLGAFAFPDAAHRLADQVRGSFGENPLVMAGADTLHRVRFGPYPERALAEQMRDRLLAAGVGRPTVVSGP